MPSMHACFRRLNCYETTHETNEKALRRDVAQLRARWGRRRLGAALRAWRRLTHLLRRLRLRYQRICFWA